MPAARPVKVLNPIAAHLDVMRTSLLPGLVDTLRTNVNRKVSRVRIFEVGRIFSRANSHYDQPLRVGGLAFGPARARAMGRGRCATSTSSTSRATSKRWPRRAA